VDLVRNPESGELGVDPGRRLGLARSAGDAIERCERIQSALESLARDAGDQLGGQGAISRRKHLAERAIPRAMSARHRIAYGLSVGVEAKNMLFALALHEPPK
jgi:hypothetical protein